MEAKQHDTKHGPKCKHEHIIKSRLDDESEQMGKLSQETLHKKVGEKSNIQSLDIHTLFIWIFYRDSPFLSRIQVHCL